MSYLHTPRLIFSGDFQADVSTVNNDVRYYNNAKFISRFQEKENREKQQMNGLWNPNGGATFKLLNCSVKKLTYEDNVSSDHNSEDSLIGQLFAGASERSAGKIVDLDPQFQLTSELWGISIRVHTLDNELILQGKLLNCSFRDLQFRLFNKNTKLTFDGLISVQYSSTLTDIEWGESYNSSRFTKEIKEKTQDNCLSINFSVFGYSADIKTERFTLGYIVGAIGPHFSTEPKTFAPARRLIGFSDKFEYSNFLFEEKKALLTIDFGNSFPLFEQKGTTLNVGRLYVAVGNINGILPLPGKAATLINTSDHTIIGEINYQQIDWLRNTSGIVSFSLSTNVSSLLKNHQLLLLGEVGDGSVDQNVVIAAEHDTGLLIRADQSVLRIDPGESRKVDIYSYLWGNPLKNTEIECSLAAAFGDVPVDPNNPDPSIEILGAYPFTGIPVEALSFQNKLISDKQGVAELVIKGFDPKNPRAYIDGQVYFITYKITGLPPQAQPFLDLIVLHLRDKYNVPDKPGWNDLKPIFTQYANLYPVMSKHIVDLRDREDVLKHKKILLYAFTREIDDPSHMPVSRDLSLEKRKVIVSWLENMIEDESTDASLIESIMHETKKVQLLPKEKDLMRPPAIVMKRSKFKEFSREIHGKGAALRKLRNAIKLIDD